MGVRGLNSYMTSQKLGEYVDLECAAKKYRKETGKKPSLLIDLSSCIIFLYPGASLALAADLRKYKERCEEFVDQLYSLDIKLIIVADGIRPKNKLKSWIHNNDTWVMQSMHNILQDSDTFRTCLLSIAIEVFSSSDKCKFCRAIYEADDYIAEYLKNFKVFGVLTNDSDFILMDGSLYCFSISYFNFRQMKTFNFNRNKLAGNLNIDVKLLPLVGTLCPNHVLGVEDLKEFYCLHRIHHPDFKNVAKVVRNHLSDYTRRKEFFKRLKSYQSVLGLNDHQLEKFRERLESLNGENQNKELKLTNNKNWDDILTSAKNMHFKGLADRRILELLVEKVFFCSVGLENVMMTSPDDELQHLRRKMFGFLFFEHPEEVSVKEHLYVLSEKSTKMEYCCREVTFRRRDHIGLLKLWSSDPPEDVQKQKYKFFFEIINEKLDPDILVGKVKEEFAFPVLAVFYLRYELRRFKTSELDTLLIQSVLTNKLSSDEVAALEYDPVIEAFNLCGWYLKIIGHLEFLNSICGNPFDPQKTNMVNHLEGRVLHRTYKKMKFNIKIEEYLSPEVLTTFRCLKDILDKMKQSCGFE